MAPGYDLLKGTTEDSFQIGKKGPQLERIAATTRLKLADLLRWLPGGAAIAGHLQSDSSGDLTVIKDNLAASAAPTINDDSGSGYAIGSVWINTSNDRLYFCVDASVGAAVWLELSIGDVTATLTDEPTGFPNLTDSEISFNDGLRRFTIQPKAPATEFNFYQAGREFTVNSADTVDITDTSGLWYIYYDNSGTLTANLSVWDFETEVPVATIYWDSVANLSILGEERHGLVMDWMTHQYLHNTLNARWVSGLDISGYALDTDTDAAVTFGISSGVVADEDLFHSIVQDATPTEDFEQDLADPGQIPIYYRAGANGEWKKDTATDYAFKNTASGRVNWNELTGGVWQQTEAGNGNYVAYWIFATSHPSEPIISIQGQREDTNFTNARQNNSTSSLVLGDLPGAEFKLLYRIIVETNTGFSNTRKAQFAQVLDLRSSSQGILGQSLVPFSHSALSNLDADDHLQYFNENNSGEINALTPKGTPVSADVILIEDSAATYAKKKATLGTLPRNPTGTVRGISFNEQDRTYLRTGNATYTTMGLLRFAGSTTEGTFTIVKAIVSTSDTGNTGSFQLYDLTNANTIAEVTGVTHAAKDTPKIVTLTVTGGNIPSAEAMFEVQAKKTAGGGEVRIHEMDIEF